MGAGEYEDLILDCYWLASWYRQNPEVFLSMPIGEVRLHMERTIQVAKRMQTKSNADGD